MQCLVLMTVRLQEKEKILRIVRFYFLTKYKNTASVPAIDERNLGSINRVSGLFFLRHNDDLTEP